jgi:threonine aldolase
MTPIYEYGSDNHSGIHPDILDAIINANKGYEIAYGDDKYTKSAIEKFKDNFGTDIDVYFVGNGTAANILGIKAVTESYNSIICAETAHLNVHECCGPEKFIGCKLVTIPTKDGKLTTDLIKPHLVGFDDPHMAQPKVISLTQSTELGTVYKPDEIKKLSNFAHKHDMLIHVDGARLCNSAASLNKSFKSTTADVGVDILSFGGTKNGMMFGDAVIFFSEEFSKNFEFIRKQGMQLTSKMRYISSQFNAFFKDDLWLRNAEHANKMTELLYSKIKDIKDIEITQKVEVNAIFAQLKKEHLDQLLKKFFFHIFDENNLIVRWMCSFNTTEESVNLFADEINNVIK